MRGIFLTGWQFKNRVVLRTSSIPNQIYRSLAQEFGAPPVGEEVYGRPAAPELLRLRESLLAGPRRGADVVEKLLQREQFDMLWISLSAAHLGGHRFFDLSPISGEAELSRYPELGTALLDIYQAVDEALARIVASLPAGTDILVVSPSGMGPNCSRSHLLPGMLEAVMADHRQDATGRGAPAGSLLWRIRALMPTGLRGLVANALPDRWALELAARLELRGVDWKNTRAFMMPNDDAGYIRLNLRGRERDGIVDPREADALLNKLRLGLETFRDTDGSLVIRRIHRTAELGYHGPCEDQLPDLIVEWNHRVVSPLAGVSSPAFGVVSSPGWATGRTGCHNSEAWALVVSGSSKLRAPKRTPHIVDIVPTVCAAVGVDYDGLSGEPLLEQRSRA
jgi:predicted AlkP superfamily phosphohydrolase/phosphomutase